MNKCEHGKRLDQRCLACEKLQEVENKHARNMTALQARITELEQVAREISVAGNLMSNVLYNLKQQERFTPQEKATIESLQQRWDKAVIEIRKAALLQGKPE